MVANRPIESTYRIDLSNRRVDEEDLDQGCVIWLSPSAIAPLNAELEHSVGIKLAASAVALKIVGVGYD